jgi:hypothetical protein
MTTDLGFFSPAVIAQSEDDEESLQIQDINTSKMVEDSLVVENKPEPESAREVPHDFDLQKTKDIFDLFLSNDLDYVAAQALDARHYLEHVIDIFFTLDSFAISGEQEYRFSHYSINCDSC